MTEVKKPLAKKPPTKKVVTISSNEISRSSNVAMLIIKKLEEANIPIIPSLPLGRVTSGILTSREDIANDCYIYEWQA